LERVFFLGTANAISSASQENAHIFFESEKHKILVDCPGNPISRMAKAGINPLEITDLIITHFHPDHVSGLPLLLMDLWLMGRKTPLNIYGLSSTIDHAEGLMDVFDWKKWQGFFPVQFNRIEEIENVRLLSADDLQITTSPGKHLIPSIGLRFEFPLSQKIVVYSSDTEPCPSIQTLANGATILIHEAAGPGKGHTTPESCGKIAQQAHVNALYLIHYTKELSDEELVSEANRYFEGQVVVCKDLMQITLG
jgi:ribonuclease Z